MFGRSDIMAETVARLTADVNGVMVAGMDKPKCDDHHEVPVSVLLTGWIVTQCPTCGAVDIVAPRRCGFDGCGKDHSKDPE